MSPETYVGNSRNVVEPSLAEKLNAGTGGAELMLGMFDSVSTLLDAHKAPDAVKQAVENLKQEIIKWANGQSAPTQSHDEQ